MGVSEFLCPKADTRASNEEVIHIHECPCQEGEDKQLRALQDRCSDQKRHEPVHSRVNQCPEGTPEEGTALDQEVGDE